VISEGSCDTGDWSNDAEKAITGINIKAVLNCKNITDRFTVFLIKINAVC